MKTDAVRARNRTEVLVAPEVTAILDELREEQVGLVESIRAASTAMSGASSRVAFAMAGHARLTQQFFDAQRAILMRLATFDAQAGDDHVRTSDPFVERASADLIEAQRELANLLDDWWAATNRHGEQMLARAAARAPRPLPPPAPWVTPALGTPVIAAAFPAPTALPIAPAGTAAPSVLPPPAPAPVRRDGAGTWPSPVVVPQLPADVVHALDRADVTNLDEVLASIADALRTSLPEHLAPAPVVAEQGSDDLIIGLRPRTADELLAGLEMLERRLAAPMDDGDESAARRLVTRTVLPMVAATTALTAVMAWIG